MISRLCPLLVPDIGWKTIGINFVVKLPESIEFNMIITVVNLASKKTYFILIHMTITMKGTMRLFLYNI